MPKPETGPDRYFLGPRFAGLSFAGFGPGYTGLPDGLQGYVDAIFNDINWETGDHVFPARAPRDRVLDRDACEFWSGHGEGASDQPPAWVGSGHAARPILRDPGRIGHPTMCHVPGIDRFLLTDSTASTPHTAYLPQVPTPWLDADGLGGWMVFSGDYSDANAPDSYHGFMTRHFRFDRLASE